MTDSTGDADRFDERVRVLLSQAVAALDPADCAERVAWCREHDEHGIHMHTSDADSVLEFRWGGRTLAMVRGDDLAADVPLRAEFVSEDVPDTVPDDLLD